MNPITWTFTTEAPDTTKPTVTSTNPTTGATGVQPGAAVRGVFSEAVQEPTISFELRTPSNVLVPATRPYNAATRTATLTPTSTLALGTTFTARISAARDAAGNTMDPVTWTFTTSTSTSACPCTIWTDTATPERTDADPSRWSWA